MADEYLKVAVVGAAGVGKSAFLRRACRNEFTRAYEATRGVECYKAALSDPSGATPAVRVAFWDCGAAQLVDDGRRNRMLAGCACVILMYDITRGATWDLARGDLYAAARAASPRAFIVLLGNKADVDAATPAGGSYSDDGGNEDGDGVTGVRRAVAVDAAERWAAGVGGGGVLFMETSAADGTNVDLTLTLLRMRLASYSSAASASTAAAAVANAASGAGGSGQHDAGGHTPSLDQLALMSPHLHGNGAAHACYHQQQQQQQQPQYGQADGRSTRTPRAADTTQQQQQPADSRSYAGTGTAEQAHGSPAAVPVTSFAIDDLRSPRPAEPAHASGQPALLMRSPQPGFMAPPLQQQQQAQNVQSSAAQQPVSLPPGVPAPPPWLMPWLMALGAASTGAPGAAASVAGGGAQPFAIPPGLAATAWPHAAASAAAPAVPMMAQPPARPELPTALPGPLPSARVPPGPETSRAVAAAAAAVAAPPNSVPAPPLEPVDVETDPLRRIVLWVDVAIAGNHVGRIAVRRHDNAFALAHKFVSRHRLPITHVTTLAKLITDRLDTHLREEAAVAEEARRQKSKAEAAAWRRKVTVPKPFTFALDVHAHAPLPSRTQQPEHESRPHTARGGASTARSASPPRNSNGGLTGAVPHLIGRLHVTLTLPKDAPGGAGGPGGTPTAATTTASLAIHRGDDPAALVAAFGEAHGIRDEPTLAALREAVSQHLADDAEQAARDAEEQHQEQQQELHLPTQHSYHSQQARQPQQHHHAQQPWRPTAPDAGLAHSQFAAMTTSAAAKQRSSIAAAAGGMQQRMASHRGRRPVVPQSVAADPNAPVVLSRRRLDRLARRMSQSGSPPPQLPVPFPVGPVRGSFVTLNGFPEQQPPSAHRRQHHSSERHSETASGRESMNARTPTRASVRAAARAAGIGGPSFAALSANSPWAALEQAARDAAARDHPAPARSASPGVGSSGRSRPTGSRYQEPRRSPARLQRGAGLPVPTVSPGGGPQHRHAAHMQRRNSLTQPGGQRRSPSPATSVERRRVDAAALLYADRGDHSDRRPRAPSPEGSPAQRRHAAHMQRRNSLTQPLPPAARRSMSRSSSRGSVASKEKPAVSPWQLAYGTAAPEQEQPRAHRQQRQHVLSPGQLNSPGRDPETDGVTAPSILTERQRQLLAATLTPGVVPLVAQAAAGGVPRGWPGAGGVAAAGELQYNLPDMPPPPASRRQAGAANGPKYPSASRAAQVEVGEPEAVSLPAGPPLFNLDIDIGGGRRGRITVTAGAAVTDLAAGFVRQHGLPLTVRPRLEQLIAESLALHQANANATAPAP